MLYLDSNWAGVVDLPKFTAVQRFSAYEGDGIQPLLRVDWDSGFP